MPSISAKNMTASMSPSAIAETGLRGTICTSRSTPDFGADAAVTAAARSPAPSTSRARVASDMPSPGRSRLVRPRPSSTAMVETTTV